MKPSKAIQNIIDRKLLWIKIPESKRYFHTPDIDVDECVLRMNDFPDEPIFTLFYMDESFDLEETPRLWTITY